MQGEETRAGAPIESLLAALRGARTMIGLDVRLLQAELAGKAKSLSGALALALAGGFLLLIAAAFFLSGLALLLIRFGVEPYAACLISAGIAALCGALALRAGVRRLSHWSAAPSRTLNQMSRVFQDEEGVAHVA